MKTKLIIVTDLGLLRAYREVQNLADHGPHLELVSEFRSEAAREKLSEQVTDQAGRFTRGGGDRAVPGDLSSGERLDLETEQDRRLIARMAGRIDELLADDSVDRCYLAAGAPVHKQLLDQLNPKSREKIDRVVTANLTKADPADLLARFANAEAK